MGVDAALQSQISTIEATYGKPPPMWPVRAREEMNLCPAT